MKNANVKLEEKKVVKEAVKVDTPVVGVVETVKKEKNMEIVKEDKKEIMKEMAKEVKVEEVKVEKVEKEAAEKKPVAKKATKKKATKEAVVKVELQFAGASYDVVNLMTKVKEMHKDAKEIAMYVKPEEKMVYFVVDGEAGKMEM